MNHLLPILPPVNQMHTVVQEFLDGAPFAEVLCDQVILTYDLGQKQTQGSYKRHINFVKDMLNKSDVSMYGTDVCIIQTSLQYNFSDVETALVVRLTNLATHCRRIIVVNDRIVYVPKNFKDVTEEDLRKHAYFYLQRAKQAKAWKALWQSAVKRMRFFNRTKHTGLVAS